MVAVVRWSRYGRLGRMGEDRADRRACVGRVWPRGLRGAEAGGARGVLSSATALAAGRHWVAEAEGWKDLGERRREYVLRRLGTEGEGEFQPDRAYIRGHHCGCTSAPYEQAISGKEGALCAGPCSSSGGPALPAVPAQPGCRHACLAALDGRLHLRCACLLHGGYVPYVAHIAADCALRTRTAARSAAAQPVSAPLCCFAIRP